MATSHTIPDSSVPLPRVLTYPSSPAQLITQGAEAHLYKSTFLVPSLTCAIKYRPPKPYRHPTLDARLTKHRILSEARILVKLRKAGVRVPAVYALDEANGWMCLEWVPGGSLRVCLEAWLMEKLKTGAQEAPGHGMSEVKDLMRRVGLAVGELHAAGVVHGDLTTSNLMLKPVATQPLSTSPPPVTLEGEIVVIDFGLASVSVADEDRAVDLYVLERAFGSTHPKAEEYFGEVLAAYRVCFGGAKSALNRLEDVRARGRKRSMLG